MTDEEIIKALECCTTRDRGTDLCRLCPCYDDSENWCDGLPYAEVLALINRQKAEIEELKTELLCEVGNTLYQCDDAGRIYKITITGIIYNTSAVAFDERAIGKSVFLTRKEAEKAVKEREKDDSRKNQ